MQRFFAFLISKVWDFLLVAVLSISAAGLVATGYWSGDAYVAMPAMVVAVGVVTLLLLYCASYNGRTLVAGIIAIPVLTVIALVAASTSFGGTMFDDVVGNPCPTLLASVVTTVVCYLLTRKKPGVVVLLFIGVILVGYLQFIYKEGHVVLSAVFLSACAATLAFRGFTQFRSFTAVQSKREVPAALGICVAASVLLVCLGAGLYAAVVAPLNPPTMEIKLIKEYLALPTVDLTGIADHSSTENKNKRSNKSNDDEQIASGKSDESKESEGDEGSGTQDQAQQQENPQFDEGADGQMYNTTTHSLSPLSLALLWLIPIVLVIALIFGAVRFKLSRRKRRLDAIAALEPGERVTQSYLLTMKLFDKLKVPNIAAKTPLEHAESCKEFVDDFHGEDGSSFSDLTEAYVAVAYGKAKPTEEQLQKTGSFLKQLYPNAKRHLGMPAYLLKFFFL